MKKIVLIISLITSIGLATAGHFDWMPKGWNNAFEFVGYVGSIVSAWFVQNQDKWDGTERRNQ